LRIESRIQKMDWHIAPGFGLGPGGNKETFKVATQAGMRGEGRGLHSAFAEDLLKDRDVFLTYRTVVIQIGGRQGNQNYSIMLQSLNTDELYQWAPKLEQAVSAEVREVQDVSTDLEQKSPRINLVMDRDKAAMVGLNVSQIQNALYDGLGPKWSSTIYGFIFVAAWSLSALAFVIAGHELLHPLDELYARGGLALPAAERIDGSAPP
jgi:hypothetical protein